MLFVIKRKNAYFHNKGRIILFESDKEAENFINMFIQYSMNRLSDEKRFNEIINAPRIIISQSKIIPVDF